LNIVQAIILGIVQGATEFIPVSSSGHLVLVPWLLGWQAPGLAFTVVVHVGTAIGVVLFFWREWLAMLKSIFVWLRTHEVNADLRLLVLLILGTIPAALVGVFFQSFVEGLFNDPMLVALMLIVTGAILFAGERLGRLERPIVALTWVDALLIGLAQMIAIVPGISRSGSTITAGLLRRVQRDDAARFSFLLSTPIIIGSGAIEVLDLAKAGLGAAQIEVLVVGFLAAFVTAFFVIRWLLTYLRSHSTDIFAAYCAIAGIVLVTIALIGIR
jgi:undecaprenyl-diphosphatase